MPRKPSLLDQAVEYARQLVRSGRYTEEKALLVAAESCNVEHWALVKRYHRWTSPKSDLEGSSDSGHLFGQQRVRMGEAVRLRLEGWMRTAVDKHRTDLAKRVGHPLSVGGAIRDLLGQALRGATTDAAYLNGYAQGFLSGYSDGKQAGQARAQRTDGPRSSNGPIRPHPTHGKGDYQGGEEGE